MRPRIEAEQGSPQWYAARRGMLTGSRMADAMSFTQKGKPTADRNNYMDDVVNERLTGIAATHYVTPAMAFGLEQEQFAREAYEIATGNLVEPAGLILHPTIEFFGASPDGLVGKEGLAEFKVPQHRTFLRWLRDGVVPEEHKAQMIAECVCAQRQWVDFVAYQPDFGERKLFVRRYTPTAEERQRVEDEARRFLDEVEQMFDRVLSTEMIA